MGALQNMGRRLFLDEPSALPELMISLIDALAAVRRMRRMRRGLRPPCANSVCGILNLA
jgi:hypothetical protein